MSFRNRALARVGAGAFGLLVAGAFAAPAFASSVDVAVKVDGTKIAVDATEKVFFAKITNLGDAIANGLTVEVDLTGLDADVVTADLTGIEACGAPAVGKITCDFTGTLSKDEIFDFPIVLKPAAGKSGPAGSFKVDVSSAGDENPDNNSVTVEVTVEGKGPDLIVVADDVAAGYDEDGTVQPLAPGETAELHFAIINHGTAPTGGLEVKLQLPEHVTFVDDVLPCVTSPDRGSMDCALDGFDLLPGEALGDEGFFVVKVAADAPAPISPKGSVSAVSLGQLPEGPQANAAPAHAWAAAEQAPDDVDAGDNIDEFTVFVAAADGGTGGGLPVTGAEAGLIGGIGLAVVVAGGAIFLVARRRKVVLVTPADEKPTA